MTAWFDMRAVLTGETSSSCSQLTTRTLWPTAVRSAHRHPEMAKWSIEDHNARQLRTQHLIGNHTFDIRGDVADTETYWHYGGFNKPPLPPVSLIGGRYLDHFERRGGRWAIAHRKVLIDWHGNAGEHLAPDVIEGFNRPRATHRVPSLIRLMRNLTKLCPGD